jgi:hypothetical protein
LGISERRHPLRGFPPPCRARAQGEGEIAMRLHERIHAMRQRRRRLPLRDRLRSRRRLVELGLKVTAPEKPVNKPGRRQRAQELAAKRDREDDRSRCAARRTRPASASTHQGAVRIPRGPRRSAEGEGEMRATKLQELEVMAAKLQATARKLPHGPDRRDLLQEIGRFRVQIIALQSAAGLRSASPGLKAK